jgi:hypothetical protein
LSGFTLGEPQPCLHHMRLLASFAFKCPHPCPQPQCAGTELATSGYQFFAYLLNGSRPMYINSLDGKYRCVCVKPCHLMYATTVVSSSVNQGTARGVLYLYVQVSSVQ